MDISGGHNSFGLEGKKKDLLKAFTSDEFAQSSDLPKTLNKQQALKMYPEIK